MPTKIQLKRGSKPNLPILSVGEAAFTTDTKELFIGDGTANYNMTPKGKNLIANSNFQYFTQEGDYTSLQPYWLTSNKSLYFHGNYYISNKSFTTGTITYVQTAVSFKTGLKRLNCFNSKPVIEYRCKLPKFTANNVDYYPSSLEGMKMTVSLDIRNLTGTPFTFQVGCPNNMVSLTSQYFNEGILIERLSATFTYKSSVTTNSPSQYGFHDFVLFSKVDGDITGQIDIGNFKVEFGSSPTLYTSNSLEEDACIIDAFFQQRQDYFRAATVNQSNFIIYIPRERNDFFNYDVRVNVISANIIPVYYAYGEQTGFTWEVDNTFSSSITKVTFTKENHGLNDVGVLLKYTVDYRPYY